MINATESTLLAMQAFETPPPALRSFSALSSPRLPIPNTKAMAPFFPTTVLTSPTFPLMSFAAKALDSPRPNSRFTP